MTFAEEQDALGYQDGFADRMRGANLASVTAVALWGRATEAYKAGWTRGYEVASNLRYLTLGAFRRATEHLPDEVPLTAGAPEGFPADWLNVYLENVPPDWPHGDDSSIILGTTDDFDTRQW